MTTVNKSELEVGFKDAIFPMLREQTVDVDKFELSGCRDGHSHQPDSVRVLVRS